MPRRIDSQIEAEICRAYRETPSSLKLAKRFGISKCAVLHVLQRNNIDRRWMFRKEMDGEILESIKGRYIRGASIKDLSEEFRIAWSTLHTSLAAAGVVLRSRSQSRRLYELDEAAFDAITEDSAYWVGFLMADGCIVQDRYAKSIHLGLAVIDEDHIRRFLRFLGANHPITRRTQGNSELAKLNGHTHSNTVSIMSKITINSSRLCDALGRFGVTTRKTHTAEVHHLGMNRDFWRGMIDGDGFVFVDGGGHPRLGLVGSERIIEQFRDFAVSYVPQCKSSISKYSSIFTYRFSGLASMRMIDVLYRDCKTSLDRKKAIADSLLSDPDNFKDKRIRWHHLTLDVLTKQRERLGSWVAVASENGITVPSLSDLRMRLRLKDHPQS